MIKVWDPRVLNALSTKSPTPISSSKPPATHTARDYGITSITTQNSIIYALSKDSQYHPKSMRHAIASNLSHVRFINCSLYAYSSTHLDHGPIGTFSHPRLKCDTFWIKLAIKNDLIATGSSDASVILLPSSPDHWSHPVTQSDTPSERTSRGVVLRGGHSREVTDVAFTWGDGGVCSIGDDTVVRVWRERDVGENLEEGKEREREMGCGWGWAEW